MFDRIGSGDREGKQIGIQQRIALDLRMRRGPEVGLVVEGDMNRSGTVSPVESQTVGEFVLPNRRAVRVRSERERASFARLIGNEPIPDRIGK